MGMINSTGNQFHRTLCTLAPCYVQAKMNRNAGIPSGAQQKKDSLLSNNALDCSSIGCAR